VTLKEIEDRAKVRGHLYWEFDLDVFAKLLVQEICNWSKPMIGMSDIDEQALREHLGME